MPQGLPDGQGSLSVSLKLAYLIGGSEAMASPLLAWFLACHSPDHVSEESGLISRELHYITVQSNQVCQLPAKTLRANTYTYVNDREAPRYSLASLRLAPIARALAGRVCITLQYKNYVYVVQIMDGCYTPSCGVLQINK